MRTLKAADVMMRPVVSAKPSASARDVALQLLTGLFSGMPVTDEKGQVIGVITEIDLLTAVLAGKELVRLTAQDVMSTDVVTADVESSVADIIGLMKEKNVIRLPITEKGRLVGVVARCDVLKSLIEPEFVTYM
jgi:predicted transcriptional regulator